MALPYQDLPILDACLATGTHYMDTANYEPRDVAKFEYHWQWAYQDRFKEAGLTAILGCGFDHGFTNIYCAYAQPEGLFYEIAYIDGPKKSYLIYHEEEESLVKHIKCLKQIRFWMTFGEEYIKHLDVFKSIGLIGLEPIKH